MYYEYIVIQDVFFVTVISSANHFVLGLFLMHGTHKGCVDDIYLKLF